MKKKKDLNKQVEVIVKSVSKCCKAPVETNVPVKDIQPGMTIYYKCTHCGEACETVNIKYRVEKKLPSGEDNRFGITTK